MRLVANPETIPAFIIIVLDALDECKDPEPVSTILSLLSKSVEEISFVGFFVTSRPEYDSINFGCFVLYTQFFEFHPMTLCNSTAI
jgi:hypothetical protein